MNQSFSTKFPWGEETHFIEKLWRMALNESKFTQDDLKRYSDNKFIVIDNPMNYNPKMHTIRGCSARFKVRQLQQPFIWTGKPYNSLQFYFMPPMPIISKQRIVISNHEVWVDGKGMLPNRVEELSRIDGFESVSDFFRWFNKDFEGEIRHYTNLRY